MGADVDAEDDFPVLDLRVAVAQIHAALADRFHLGAEQRHACFEYLEDVEDVIVVKGFEIFGDVRSRPVSSCRAAQRPA